MAYGTINADLMTTSDGVSSSGLYGFKNRILNGQMVIDQRNAGASVTVTAGINYTTDRFFIVKDSATTGVMTAQQSTTAPAGFTNSVKLTTTTAQASLAATDYVRYSQIIEGYNVADLGFGSANAKTVTLSFWVRSSLTGTFGGSLGNSAWNRTYPFTYTISAADTWEQKSITVAGDTSGTWLTDNGKGLRVDFGLGVGSTYSGTANAWASALYISATGATSVVGTNGATFYLTGVQLEKGSTATSFDYRPYSAELAMCQRYFVRWRNSSGSNGYQFNPQASPIQSGTTGNIAVNAQLPVVMRDVVTVTNNLTNANYTTSWTMDSAFVTGNVTKTGTVGINVTGSASTVTIALTGATWSPAPNLFYLTASTAYVDITAEL